MESWLASSEEPLLLVLEGTRKPDYWVELSTVNLLDSTWAQDSDFAKFKTALFGLRYGAQLLTMKGDASGAWDCVIAVCRMARHMGGSGSYDEELENLTQGNYFLLCTGRWATHSLCTVADTISTMTEEHPAPGGKPPEGGDQVFWPVEEPKE